MFKSQNAENGMGTNGWAMFCLPKFEVKFETRNGAIFMFRADKVLHCTMKTQKENQYGMTFFQKKILLNHLKSLKGWSLSLLNQINILIDFLFEMFFSFLFSKKSSQWVNMYVFHMGTKVISWGKHLLNKNNYHAPEVHEIIFLFKMCTWVLW